MQQTAYDPEEIECVISSLQRAIESQQQAIDALQRLWTRPRVECEPVPLSATPTQSDVFTFTRRQAQVLDLLADGATNRRIGKVLGIKEQTVKAHVHAVLSKLGASHRAEAVSIAYKWGLLRAETA
ncbi:LuxR C-terminal-related transcriptional regulator [Nocardia brasiliensis]|uniref:LuxR C-terminal-related transcriptional regulator n=1 Tax=Nocardia brasiliensis TaxID=37326 RepID=UPI00367352E9